MIELITCDNGGWKLLGIFFHCRSLVSRRRYRDISGLDAPLGGALGSRHPLDEFYRSLLLLGRRALEDIETAAAGRRAAPFLGGQDRDTEVELGALLHRRQITGGVPHHRGFAFEEIG